MEDALAGFFTGIILLINIIILIGMVCLSFHLMTMIGLTGYGRVFASLAVALTWFKVFIAIRMSTE